MNNIIEEIFFNGYPREMGDHRWVAKTKEDALGWIQRNNGYVNCYSSIYSFNHFNSVTGRPLYESANVSHIYLDLDGEKCKEDMIKIHEYLMKDNIKHFLMFSGRGYHVYIFCQTISNITVDFSVSEALANYQNYLGELLSVEICSSCRGNLSKVSRITNTYHISQKRFSIPVSDPYQNHILLASQPQWNLKTFGSTLIDLSVWKSKKVADPIDIPTADIQGVDFPPCMIRIINNPNPSFNERMALVSYLNETFRYGAQTISTDDIIRITNQIVDFLQTLGWQRFSISKTKKYTRYLVKGLYKSFSHQKIRNMGICCHCGG